MPTKNFATKLREKTPQLWTGIAIYITLLAVSIFYLVEYYDTLHLFHLIGWILLLSLVFYDTKQMASTGLSQKGQWIRLGVWGVAAVVLMVTHVLYLQHTENADKRAQLALEEEKKRNKLLHQELKIIFKNEEELRKLLQKAYDDRQKGFEKSAGHFGRSLKKTREELEACLQKK